jgi:LAO/AO transport system kinase
VTDAAPDAAIGALVDAALTGDKRAIARLVTRFEDDRPDAAHARQAALARLDLAGATAGRVVGFTGAPGVGKSTLVGAVANRIVEQDPRERVAVVAVDPSSPLTGGALLGDRTRVRFAPDEARLYFRSQASAAELGGVARATHQACRVLVRLFSTVIVETVGVGQGEVEIVRLADRTFLVLQPHGGDHVQFMKAGIMEVPDVFVVSKGDLDGATVTVNALGASLRLAAPGAGDRPILRTSALTGDGIDAVAAAVVASPRGGLDGRAPYYFERWVAAEYGRAGLRRLSELSGSRTADYVDRHIGLDGAQLAFAAAMTA